jgi:hypothetical protein
VWFTIFLDCFHAGKGADENEGMRVVDVQKAFAVPKAEDRDLAAEICRTRENVSLLPAIRELDSHGTAY